MAEFEHLEELTLGLYDTGALKFSNFEFTVKPRAHETEPRPSPVYYNQRPIVSFDDALEVKGQIVSRELQERTRLLAVNAYAHKLDEVETPFDHLYSIPQGVTAIGCMVAFVTGHSILWGRVGQKDYGAHASIEGRFQEGDVVEDLDDVITSAGSKRESADSKAKAGLTTGGFVVMLDREEGGAEVLRAHGYELESVIGLAKAMAILRDNGRTGQQEQDWVDSYHAGLRADGLM